MNVAEFATAMACAMVVQIVWSNFQRWHQAVVDTVHALVDIWHRRAYRTDRMVWFHPDTVLDRGDTVQYKSLANDITQRFGKFYTDKAHVIAGSAPAAQAAPVNNKERAARGVDADPESDVVVMDANADVPDAARHYLERTMNVDASFVDEPTCDVVKELFTGAARPVNDRDATAHHKREYSALVKRLNHDSTEIKDTRAADTRVMLADALSEIKAADQKN